MRTGPITRHCIWIYGKGWQVIVSLFVSFEKSGLDPESFATPGIIVVNHRSFFDTYCMNMLPKSDICFAVRAWPFKIPVYSLFMGLARYLDLETNPWPTTMALAKKRLAQGSFLLFFPEGHRSRDCTLTRFHSGAFKLACECNVPVIPVCLTGTGTLLPPKRLWLAPSKIVLKGLPPVHPHRFPGETGHIALGKEVKTLMAKTLETMEDVDLKP